MYKEFSDDSDKFGSGVNYPADTTDRAKKLQKWWGLKYARAMFADFRNGNASSLYQYQNRILENRLFATGHQSITPYKKLVGDNDKDDSYINLDFRIAGIIPKFVDVTVGNMCRYDNNITITAIDPFAVDEKENAYWMKYAAIKMRPAFEQFNEMAGEKVSPELSEGEPQTIEELEVYMQDGFYKLEREVAMELAVSLIFYLNDWKKIEYAVKYDQLVDGIGGTKNYFLDNGFIKIRRVNSAKLILGVSNTNDFSDLRHIGEVISITINELRAIAGNEFTEDQYADIAKRFENRFGNPAWSTFSAYPTWEDYNSFKIEVMEFEFKTTDRMEHEKKTNSHGNTNLYNTPSTGKNRDVISTDFEVVYSGFWVIGSEYLAKYEVQSNQTRESTNLYKANFTYNIYAPNMVNGRITAMVERMIPFGNSFQLGWLKIQNLKAETGPPASFIEISGLMNVPIGKGGKTVTPLQVLKLGKQTGKYLWNRGRIEGDKNNYKPIENVPSYFEQHLNGLITGMNYDIEMLRAVTGINEIADSSTPNPNQPVGTSQMALNASSNATMAIMRGYQYVKEKTARAVCDRILMLEDKPGADAGYVKALGMATMKIINSGGKTTLAEYGLTVENIPDDRERAYVEAQIQSQLEIRAKSGTGGIELEDALAIRRIKNVKRQEQLLIVRRRERKKQDAKEAAGMEQMKAMAADKSIKSKMLADIQFKQAEAVIQINVNDHTKEWEYNIAMINGLLKLKGITLQQAQELGILDTTFHQDVVKQLLDHSHEKEMAASEQQPAAAAPAA